MKYEKEILEAFDSINKKPINNQLEAIEKIVTAYVDEGFKNVVLSASTGSGKSIIAVVASIVVNNLLNKENNLKSLILMHNNMLVDQYHATFNGHDKFWQILGNKNYECLVSPMPNATADDCIIEFLSSTDRCKSCLYFQNKVLRNEVEHLITNYSYYFTVASSPVEVLKKRFMNIWDEAHTINDVFVDHNTLTLNENSLGKIIKDAEEVSLSSVQNLRGILNIIKTNRFSENILIPLLTEFNLQINLLTQIFEETRSEYYNKGEKEKYIKYKRLTTSYVQLSQTVDNYVNNWFEYVTQIDDKSVTLKPIFANTLFGMINNCEKSLFMSATVSKEYLCHAIGLNPEDTKEIILDPVFSPENKKFIFIKPINVNNHSLKEQTTINHIVKTCDNIIKFHEDEKGIILTPSFKLTETISSRLRSYHNIIEHKQKTKVIDVIEEFKSSKDGILISPSIFEGLSLDDDLCRFIILTKAPFASLVDKRIEYIAKNYPDIYKLMTLMKIVQGSGRAVRNINDHAVVYAIDSNIKKLFDSELNIWHNEFLTMNI